MPDFGWVDLGRLESSNQADATKYLGASAELIGDVEVLYSRVGRLVRVPHGDPDEPEQLALFVKIACNQVLMSRLVFVKGVLAALRMHQGDSLTHLRRAIETCAFTVRMSRHRDLCKIWCEAGLNTQAYDAYRKAFQSKDVFPQKDHPDFDPKLSILKKRFDLASKLLHGSIYGSANHFQQSPDDGGRLGTKANFFDMPPKSFLTTYFVILNTHLKLLDFYGQFLGPHLTDSAKWQSDLKFIEERVGRHASKWGPTIMAWKVERDRRQQPR